MKAREFVTEVKGFRSKLTKGKKHPTHSAASPGSIQGKGFYDLYRSSMAIAGMDADGNNDNMPDPESWMGMDAYIVAYTDQERDMTEKAYKALGSKHRKNEEGRSAEPDAVNKSSPIKGFKGYPR